MERHCPRYDINGINSWCLIRETPYSESNFVKTTNGEFVVDIHYTPEKILTVTIGHNGHLSKNNIDPILEQCGRLAHARGNYNVINYTLAGSDGIDFGHYEIGENK